MVKKGERLLKGGRGEQDIKKECGVVWFGCKMEGRKDRENGHQLDTK